MSFIKRAIGATVIIVVAALAGLALAGLGSTSPASAAIPCTGAVPALTGSAPVGQAKTTAVPGSTPQTGVSSTGSSGSKGRRPWPRRHLSQAPAPRPQPGPWRRRLRRC
jgi:hypothetical protein